MPETVLVTGGTGYVGGWCIVELLVRGYNVRTTARSVAKEPAIRAAIATQVDAGTRLSVVAADLTSDEGWDGAVEGCDYVLHVASPLGMDNPANEDDLIVPAREGALRVLRAAVAASVKRVVLTSACATSSPEDLRSARVTDETIWTDPDGQTVNAYRKSKTLAEMAAWDFMRDHGGATDLTAILPGAVFGPILSADTNGSVSVIGRFLNGKMAGTPKIGLEVVDVRDLADIHIRAMTAPEAAGERFIAVGDFMWMADIATALRAGLSPADAAKVPTRRIPDVVVKFMARRDPGLAAVKTGLGRKHRHSPAKAHRVLGWQTRPGADTVVECAQSLLTNKVV